jgi:hypothetical protein
MKFAWIVGMLLYSVAVFSQQNVAAVKKDDVQFPKIVSVKQMLSDPVPVGACKADEDRAGFLYTYKGSTKAGYMAGGLTDDYRPTKEQIGAFIADQISKGFVVAIYPQPDGWMFEESQCSPGLESLLERPKQ